LAGSRTYLGTGFRPSSHLNFKYLQSISKKLGKAIQFPLVSLLNLHHLTTMYRIKTLSLPLIAALLTSTVVETQAQVALELSSQKTYRQNPKGIIFDGGTFNINMYDGDASYIGACVFPRYVPPGIYINICAPGATGYVTDGTLGPTTIRRPYLLVTGVFPAIAIEPRMPDRIKLIAAPASSLPRPSGGFRDDSTSLFYNIQSPDATEYVLTHYYNNKNYSKSQRGKFEKEIVPGVYSYSFPRLNRPEVPAVVKAVIYPMLEGLATKNNKTSGFVFKGVDGQTWNKQGFMELSARKPNIMRWQGLAPNVVYAAADNLFFSIREIDNVKKPRSPVKTRASSIFPAFVTGGDPRVLLRTPYVSSFTTPPIFNSSTTGVIELELARTFKTGGVTYDFSRRRFQMPIVVVDKYEEYREQTFGAVKGKGKILEDTDKDGYNNLTEWILDSDANSRTDIPVAPTPTLVQDYYDYYYYYYFDVLDPLVSYFGFTIDKKVGTIPRVVYTLQRSTDGGKTWNTFKAGYYYSDGSYSPTNDGGGAIDWTVTNVNYTQSGARHSEIRVRSGYTDEEDMWAQPPGTAGHIYRVKVTLAK
jgi:hypothetical protein